jgi:hypothetical protein
MSVYVLMSRTIDLTVVELGLQGVGATGRSSRSDDGEGASSITTTLDGHGTGKASSGEGDESKLLENHCGMRN